MKRSMSLNLSPLLKGTAQRRGLIFGGIIIFALLAFEIFNYSSTAFALGDILGDLTFGPIRWATLLALFRFWWAFADTISGRHLRDLVKKALNHQPLDMVRGAGGSFVTITDLGRVMDLVLTDQESCGQVYNVGSLFLTWEEIAGMIIRLTNSKSSITLIPSDQWKGPAFLTRSVGFELGQGRTGTGLRS